MTTDIKRERLGPRQLEWRARWVLELLDTDAGQAKGTLCAYDVETGAVVGYCCLGIAQRLAAPESRRLKPAPLGAHKTADGHRPSNDGTMSKTTAALFGLRGNGDDQDTAATWNDEEEWDFERIARMVAWLTVQGGFEAVVDDGDWFEPPTDFDARAWAEEVLS